MAITGQGTQKDPWIVHNYEEIKSAYLKTNGNSKLYIKLENDIDCNDYGDVWEWETISPYTISCDYIFDLNGHTIKNIMIKSGNALFEGKTNSSIIHNGKILNIFNNDGKSVISGDGSILKNISISVNGNGLTSYAFENTFLENCAVYFKSSKLLKSVFYLGSNIGDTHLKNCDVYVDINNLNGIDVASSVNPCIFDSLRIRGKVMGFPCQHSILWDVPQRYLFGANIEANNCVIEIDTKDTGLTGSVYDGVLVGVFQIIRNSIVNKEIMSSTYANTENYNCTTAQMRDADYLNSIGFTVVKVGE